MGLSRDWLGGMTETDQHSAARALQLRSSDRLVDMGDRSVIDLQSSDAITIPALIRRNESLEPGQSLTCHYDPQTGAFTFVPGGSDE